MKFKYFNAKLFFPAKPVDSLVIINNSNIVPALFESDMVLYFFTTM